MLGRTDYGYSGVITEAVYLPESGDDVLVYSPWKAAKGCGSTDGRRIGTGSYATQTRANGQGWDGTYWSPEYDVYSGPSYFLMSLDGTC